MNSEAGWRNASGTVTKVAVLFFMMLALAAGVSGQTSWPGPSTLGYPQWVKYGSAQTHTIGVTNPGSDTLKITSIVPVKTTFPAEAWLSVAPSSLIIPPAGTDSFTITISATPFFAYGEEWWLNGRVVLYAPQNVAESVDVKIVNYVVADTVVGVVYDTIGSCGVKLIVSNHGNIGAMGIGGVNLDFTGSGECNPDADVYLFDGGPIAIRNLGGGEFVYSNGLYQAGLESEQGWKPIAGAVPGSYSITSFDCYFTGNMVNRDTSIGVNIRYYAPVGGGDSCDFIFQQTKFFSLQGGTLTGVTIGQAIDWDIWSDSGSNHSYNRSGVSQGDFVYQRGFDTGAVAGCNPDSGRFGAQMVLGMYTRAESLAGWWNADAYGMYIQVNDSLYKYDTLSENLESNWYWNEMAIAGFRARDGVHDFHTVATYKHNAGLPYPDTLTCWTLLTSVRRGTLADLEQNIDAARGMYYTYFRPMCAGCCIGTAGNVDCDITDGVDVGDLTALIDNLFITFTPICCSEEANCDGDIQNNVDIGDLTALIDHLLITFTPLPPCGC